IQKQVCGKRGHADDTGASQIDQLIPGCRWLFSDALKQIGAVGGCGRCSIDGQRVEAVLVKIAFQAWPERIALHRDEISWLQASFQVQQNTVTMHFAEHGVIDDQKVISLCKVGKAGMAEFVERTLVPLDAYMRMQLLVPLRSGNQGR